MPSTFSIRESMPFFTLLRRGGEPPFFEVATKQINDTATIWNGRFEGGSDSADNKTLG